MEIYIDQIYIKSWIHTDLKKRTKENHKKVYLKKINNMGLGEGKKRGLHVREEELARGEAKEEKREG